MQRFHRLGACLLALWLVGCASPQKKGDQAFEAGEYSQALSYYKEVIDRGTRDWELYFRAAQAAARGANFSLAERYYSRAMRYGGGTDVAKKFAEFYLKTSNYAKAVRLLQFLLESGADKQPIYNNLGTALMYAGNLLDAESYLMVAQQMEPSDPVPYINLGVLYERYLHKPELSIGFYSCYLQLSERQSQRERVRTRITELRGRYGSAGEEITCGEPYKPGAQSVAKLQAKMKELEARESEEDESPGDDRREPPESSGGTIDLQFEDVDEEPAEPSSSSEGQSESKEPADAGADASDREERPVIERGATSPEQQERAGEPTSTEKKSEKSSTADALERARRAWESDDYQTVVDEISKLSLDSLNLQAMRMYGLSYAELGENEKAGQWLKWVVDRKPDPTVVGELIDVYERLGRDDDRSELCERFRERGDYAESVEACPEPAEEDNKDKMERIRRQMKKQK